MDVLHLTDRILDAIADYVLVTDPSTRVVRMNRSCELLARANGANADRATLVEMFAPAAERQSAQEQVDALMKGPFPTRIETAWIQPAANRRAISWTIDALCDSN